MENPARARRRILVLAASPGRTRVAVRKDVDSYWHVPDSHLHWPIGRRRDSPLNVASRLLKDATLGLCGDTKQIRAEFTSFGKRLKLPSGGFAYFLPNTEKINIEFAVVGAARVRKHLDMKTERTELHSIADIMNIESHAKYGSSTIEAIRSICSKCGTLPNMSDE